MDARFVLPCYNMGMSIVKIDKPTFQRDLLNWYDQHRRSLPWREAPTPYHVWISEIMLQQTRVETVIDYFHRFTKRFPDVRALAAADVEEVTKLWEGLGYYSRARNIHRAAQLLHEQHQDALPDTYEALQKLPGIGEYTAGAIASIAFNEATPAVDGNLIRVATRLTADDGNITDADGKRRIRAFWQTLISTSRPGDFNQALMDIGATRCLPNGEPLCPDCPLQPHCSGHATGEPTRFPKKAVKRPRRIEEKTVLLITVNGRFAAHQRPDTGLLAGLWQFPMLEGKRKIAEIRTLFQDSHLPVLQIRRLKTAKFLFTHIEWRMLGYHIRLGDFNETVMMQTVGNGVPENTNKSIAISPYAPTRTKSEIAETKMLSRINALTEKDAPRISADIINEVPALHWLRPDDRHNCTFPTALKTYLDILVHELPDMNRTDT